MLNSCQVLIVATDSIPCEKTEEIVRRLGLHSTNCGSLTEARACTGEHPFRFVLCSDDLPDCTLRTAVRGLAASTGLELNMRILAGTPASASGGKSWLLPCRRRAGVSRLIRPGAANTGLM